MDRQNQSATKALQGLQVKPVEKSLTLCLESWHLDENGDIQMDLDLIQQVFTDSEGLRWQMMSRAVAVAVSVMGHDGNECGEAC